MSGRNGIRKKQRFRMKRKTRRKTVEGGRDWKAANAGQGGAG